MLPVYLKDKSKLSFRDIINYIFGSCIYLGWIVLIFDTLLGLAMICHPLDDEEAEKLLEEQELLYASKSLVNSGQQFPDLSYGMSQTVCKTREILEGKFWSLLFSQTKEPVLDKEFDQGNRRKVE